MSRSTTNWIFVTPVIAAMLLLTRPTLTGDNETVDLIVDLAGLALIALGLTIRVVAREWKASHMEEGLVTTGPYGIIRHPMYVGSYLAALGLLVILGNFYFGLAFTILYFLVHFKVAKREERFLKKHWPEEYVRYRASVPAYLPSPVRLIRKIAKRKPWAPSTWAAIRRELGTICGMLGGAILLELRESYFVKGWARADFEISVLIVLIAMLFVVWVIHALTWQPPDKASA